MGPGAGKGTSPGSRGREPLVFVSQLHKACRRVEALLGVSPPSADSGIWGLHDAAAFQRRGETGGYMRPSPAQPGTGLHVLSPVVARGPSPPPQVRAGWEPSAAAGHQGGSTAGSAGHCCHAPGVTLGAWPMSCR